jgi:Putative Actinobacterial Holin-X, holin superfamily III
MTNEIVAFAQARAKTAARRVAVPTAFALLCGLFVLFAVVGLFAALFFWLEPHRGPAAAALICAGIALVLAILASLPLMFKRRRAPPPPNAGSLPQFASLMARTAPNLAPRQLIVAAALLGLALALSGRRNRK